MFLEKMMMMLLKAATAAAQNIKVMMLSDDIESSALVILVICCSNTKCTHAIPTLKKSTKKILSKHATCFSSILEIKISRQS